MTSQVSPSIAGQQPSGLKRLRNLVISGVLVFLVVLIMLTLFQRKLMFYPDRVTELGVPGPGVRAVQTTTRDGIVLNGWHWSSRPHAEDHAAGLTVLFFHGNAGHRAHRVEICQLLTSLGLDVLIFDYRGYAENAGSPSEQGLADDAQAIWNYATQQAQLQPERLLIYGESLGGGVGTRLAAECSQAGTPPAGLILRSTFSSMLDTAAHHYPWLPVRWLLVDRFLSVTHMANVTCPCLMFHGTRDRVVPLELGRRLFDSVPERSASGVSRRFIELDAAGHNDVLATSKPQIRSGLIAFIEELGQPAG